MHQDPNEPSNVARRRELIQEEEAFRLRQEEKRLDAARKSSVYARIINTIAFLIAALEILLLLRFILRLFGANTGNTFASFILNLSEPFIAPFSTLFISPVAGEGANIFDVNILIAMIVYALAGWLVIAFVNYLRGR